MPDAGSGSPGPSSSPKPGSPAASASSEAQAGAAPETVVREFPISIQGATGTNACLPAGPNSCSSPPVPVPVGTWGENTFVELEHEGAPTSIELVLTWEAATPATENMILSVFAVRSCGEQCFEWDDGMFEEYAVGPSPLTLSAEGISLAEDEVLVMHVSVEEVNPSTGPVYMSYSIEQAFGVEGVLRALVPQA